MVYHFLTSFDSSYESFRAQLLMSTEKPTFVAVSAMAQREETRRRVMNDPEGDQGEAKTCVAQTSSTNLRSEARAREAPGNGSKVCDVCKKVGHTRESCWHLHPHLRLNREGDGKGSIALPDLVGKRGRIGGDLVASWKTLEKKGRSWDRLKKEKEEVKKKEKKNVSPLRQDFL